MNGGKIAFFISIAIHGLLLSRPGPIHETPLGITTEPRSIPIRLARKKIVRPTEEPQAQTAIQNRPKEIERTQEVPSPSKKQALPGPRVIPKPHQARAPGPMTPILPPMLPSPPLPSPKEPPAKLNMERVSRKVQFMRPIETTVLVDTTGLGEALEEIRVSYQELVGGYQVMPVYPLAARREGREGIVTLKILVLEDGRVGEVVITRSSDFLDLDHAAQDAVGQWHFEPALRNGVPVRQSALLPIRFALE